MVNEQFIVQLRNFANRRDWKRLGFCEMRKNWANFANGELSYDLFRYVELDFACFRIRSMFFVSWKSPFWRIFSKISIFFVVEDERCFCKILFEVSINQLIVVLDVDFKKSTRSIKIDVDITSICNRNGQNPPIDVVSTSILGQSSRLDVQSADSVYRGGWNSITKVVSYKNCPNLYPRRNFASKQ